MSPRRRDDEGEEVSSSPGGRAVGLRRSGLMCSAIKTAAIMSAGFLLDASPSTAAAASQPHSSSRSPALAWVGSPVTTGGVRGRRGEQGTFASTGCSRHGLRRPDALRGIQPRRSPRSTLSSLSSQSTEEVFHKEHAGSVPGALVSALLAVRGQERLRRVVDPLYATALPAVNGGGGTGGNPGGPEEPSEDLFSSSSDRVAVSEDDGASNEQAQFTVQSGPGNDTIIQSGDPQLVSDILDIVGNSMAMPPTELAMVSLTAVKVTVDKVEAKVEARVEASSEQPQAEGSPGSAVTYTETAEDLVVVEPVKVESVYGEKNSKAMITELVAFTLPLLVVWLSNPIMSLVDTAVVGAKSSIELAALGPGTSLCDNVAYMCGFLAQVTTNLGASALASGDGLQADRATRTGMFVGLGVGLGVSYVLLEHGKALLQLFLGDNSAVSSVLPFSCSYVYIRALGFVAVTVSMVLQGTYLSRKDVATPIKSVAGASMVNLVLDCIAVFGFGMGIKGAALSTTVAQWAGLLYLVVQFWPDLQRSGRVSFLPYRQEMWKFLALGAPTCLALSGQVATCIAVTVAASGCDTVALAAHQVIYGVFLLFCPIGEAVSQTVQTYLPAFTVKRPPRANGRVRSTLTFGKSAVRMIKVISAVALGLGVVNAALASLLTAGLPSLFTPDPAVWAAMREVSPLCGLSLGLHGVTMAFQGAMMATREVYPTAAIYTICSVAFSTMFVFMRRSPGLKLVAVWEAFVMYQIARCVMFGATVAWSHRASLIENFSSRDGDDADTANTDGQVELVSDESAVRVSPAVATATAVAEEGTAARVLLPNVSSAVRRVMGWMRRYVGGHGVFTASGTILRRWRQTTPFHGCRDVSGMLRRRKQG